MILSVPLQEKEREGGKRHKKDRKGDRSAGTKGIGELTERSKEEWEGGRQGTRRK